MMDVDVLSMIVVASAFAGGLSMGLPISITLIISSAVGLYVLRGFPVMYQALLTMPYSKTSSFAFSVIPLFILMGYLAERSGISEGAFRMANRWVGHLRGGLGIATVIACACFAATSGSSVATSATVGRIALSEMRKFNYSDAISAGTVASAGLLGILIPPSTMMVIYGLATRVDITQMFIAGILPGLLTVFVFSFGLYVLALVRPGLMPVANVKFTWRERFTGLADGWGILVLFSVLMGGLYGGIFTVTEAAAAGAVTAAVILIARRGFDWRAILGAAMAAARGSAMIFLILIGAGLFSQYVALSGLATDISGALTNLDLPRYMILILILAALIPLGMILEPISITLITMPIVFPLMLKLEFNPIWFGILVVKVSELANITPPIGVNVFVIRSVNRDIPLQKIFAGAFLFMILEIITLVILIAFPPISLSLLGQTG